MLENELAIFLKSRGKETQVWVYQGAVTKSLTRQDKIVFLHGIKLLFCPFKFLLSLSLSPPCLSLPLSHSLSFHSLFQSWLYPSFLTLPSLWLSLLPLSFYTALFFILLSLSLSFSFLSPSSHSLSLRSCQLNSIGIDGYSVVYISRGFYGLS